MNFLRGVALTLSVNLRLATNFDKSLRAHGASGRKDCFFRRTLVDATFTCAGNPRFWASLENEKGRGDGDWWSSGKRGGMMHRDSRK